MSNSTPLSDADCERLCWLWAKVRLGYTLTTAEDAEAASLAGRIRVIPWPPRIPTPGTLPPTVIVPIMRPADQLAGDPGVGGAPVA